MEREMRKVQKIQINKETATPPVKASLTDIDIFYCPNCGNEIPTGIKYAKKRCWDCGQNLDWSFLDE